MKREMFVFVDLKRPQLMDELMNQTIHHESVSIQNKNKKFSNPKNKKTR
jgi:hypothetical protein